MFFTKMQNLGMIEKQTNSEAILKGHINNVKL